MEDHPMPSLKWSWISTGLLAAITLSPALLSQGQELSDRSLSLHRGSIQQESSIGCMTCASIQGGGIPPGFVDQCRCPQSPNNTDCLLCTQDAAEDDQDLVQGHRQGDPGWLPGNSYQCGGQLEGGTCQGDNCVDPQPLGENCSGT